MANIKSAIKKIRQDKKKTRENRSVKERAVYLVKKIKKDPKEGSNLLKEAQKALDKAAKKGVIHKNKASRLVSKITSLTNGK